MNSNRSLMPKDPTDFEFMLQNITDNPQIFKDAQLRSTRTIFARPDVGFNPSGLFSIGITIGYTWEKSADIHFK